MEQGIRAAIVAADGFLTLTSDQASGSEPVCSATASSFHQNAIIQTFSRGVDVIFGHGAAELVAGARHVGCVHVEPDDARVLVFGLVEKEMFGSFGIRRQ